MAVDKLVDSTQLDADLTSVANAIRTKGGTSASLAFPAGFVSAVEAIPTGTTPSGTKQISITENGTVTEDVAAFANAEITVDVQGGGVDYLAKRISNALTSYESDEVTSIIDYSFYGCTSLNGLKAHNVTSVGSHAFGNTIITALAFPKVTTGIWWQVCYNMKSLQALDVNGPKYFWNQTFNNCTALKTLIVRKNSVVLLNDINVFIGSPFASNGTGGTLYVPSSLVSQYTQATNWSTILGYANNSIQAIEGSIYETQYADGTPIE